MVAVFDLTLMVAAASTYLILIDLTLMVAAVSTHLTLMVAAVLDPYTHGGCSL